MDTVHATEMLICDLCQTGWHRGCLKLDHLPAGEWFCPWCCKYQRPIAEVDSLYLGQLQPGSLMSPLQTLDDIQDLLDQCMPGARRTNAYLARLLNRAPGHSMFLQPETGLPECVVTMPHEMDALFNILHMPALREMTVVDCWAGTGTIAAACARAGVKHVIQADISPRRWSAP